MNNGHARLHLLPVTVIVHTEIGVCTCCTRFDCRPDTMVSMLRCQHVSLTSRTNTPTPTFTPTPTHTGTQTQTQTETQTQHTHRHRHRHRHRHKHRHRHRHRNRHRHKHRHRHRHRQRHTHRHTNRHRHGHTAVPSNIHPTFVHVFNVRSFEQFNEWLTVFFLDLVLRTFPYRCRRPYSAPVSCPMISLCVPT
jgi:Ni/Co efflux regulator RcnB